MTNTKNNIPIYEEQQFISEEQINIHIQEILNKFQQPIPSNFIQIETEHVCSTKPSWEGKPLSERYSFTHGEKWIQVDIPHTLMEKLELDKGQDIKQPLYLDPAVLIRPETYKGITIKNETEIFLDRPLTLDNLEKNLTKLFQQIEKYEEEKELNQETIINLKKEVEELEKLKKIWRDKYLAEKGNNNHEFQTRINQLTTERNSIQQSLNNRRTEINNLQNEIRQLNDDLTTTQQERDRIQQSLRINLINSLFKNKRISELDNSLRFLRGLLTGKNQEATNLSTQRNNLQTQINDLNQQLTNLNNLIINIQNLLGINDLNNLPLLSQEETLTSLLGRPTLTDLQTERNRVNDLNQQIITLQQESTQKDNEMVGLRGKIREVEGERDGRPTQQQLTSFQQQLSNAQQTANNLRGQNSSLQTQLNNVRTELNNTKNERDDYWRARNNHTCSCYREHLDDHSCSGFDICPKCNHVMTHPYRPVLF